MKNVIFKEGELKIFWPYYLALFVGISTPAVYVIQTVFFLSRGFTLTQVGIAFGLASLFRIVAEIPTGAFADAFGKKKSSQMCWLISTITSACFIFVHAPWQMYVLFSLEGISATFLSGSFDALAYQTCKKNNREDLINEFFAKVSFIREAGHIISYLGVVGVLYALGPGRIYNFLGTNVRGMDFLWPITACGYLAAFIIFFAAKEDVEPVKVNLRQNFIDNYRTSVEGIKYSKAHPIIRKLFLSGFFLTASYVLFADIVYQPFLLNHGFGAEKIAIIVAIASVIGAIFSLVPKSLEKQFKTEKHFIEFTIILQMVLLIGLFFLHSIFAFGMLFFFIYYNMYSFREPIFQPFKQLFMKDSIRATIGSVDSLISSVACVLVFPIAGFLVDKFGVLNTTLTAFFPLIIALIIMRSIKMESRIAH
jgi:MFS family permease